MISRLWKIDRMQLNETSTRVTRTYRNPAQASQHHNLCKVKFNPSWASFQSAWTNSAFIAQD